jgi:hypothetical protein
MLFHIALVSLTKEVSLAQLALVSAAIQKQISRDFGPLWNVEATVDAFDKLEDVPIGYWHGLLQEELPNGAAGLHKRDDNKQPFALVALTNNWPVFMSHEVLEMLVDPLGTVTHAGDSLKSGQGRVELSFPKISSARIGAMRQNQRIIRRHACDPPFAGNVCRRHVQVATQARSRESASPPSAQHRLEADAASPAAARE